MLSRGRFDSWCHFECRFQGSTNLGRVNLQPVDFSLNDTISLFQWFDIFSRIRLTFLEHLDLTIQGRNARVQGVQDLSDTGDTSPERKDIHPDIVDQIIQLVSFRGGRLTDSTEFFQRLAKLGTEAIDIIEREDLVRLVKELIERVSEMKQFAKDGLLLVWNLAFYLISPGTLTNGDLPGLSSKLNLNACLSEIGIGRSFPEIISVNFQMWGIRWARDESNYDNQ